MGWVISAGIILLGFASGVSQLLFTVNGGLPICLFWSVAGAVWIRFFNYCRRRTESKRKGAEKTQDFSVIEIPQDAHDAVSRFAWLCNLTRNRLKAMNGLSDDYFSNAQIALFYGSSDSSNKAEFWFSFDWAMEGFHNTMGYQLGEGLTVIDNDRLTFSSNQISGLKTWGNMQSVQYDQERATALAGLVALTFTNECPDAYVKDSQVFKDGLYVSFKFR